MQRSDRFCYTEPGQFVLAPKDAPVRPFRKRPKKLRTKAGEKYAKKSR